MPQANPDKPILAVLLGDATGIGPELVAKIASDGFLAAECRPVVLGDRRVLAAGMRVAGVDFPVRIVASAGEADFSLPGISIIDTADNDPAAVKIGSVDPICGRVCGDACRRAADMWKINEIAGLVFAPFNKAAMKQGGYNYESEHQLFGEYLSVTTPYGEINALEGLITSRVTSHIPLAEVSGRLTAPAIFDAIRLLRDTSRLIGAAAPRIGVAAINPHGGEQGLCGREEIDVIRPAIDRAKAEGIDAAGPFPSDTVFVRAFKGDFDAVVTMYHDQGQIALKVKGFDRGVTLAGGQPFPIATPAHGTAHDIAGKNRADTGAIKAAVRLAARMAANQRAAGTARAGGAGDA